MSVNGEKEYTQSWRSYTADGMVFRWETVSQGSVIRETRQSKPEGKPPETEYYWYVVGKSGDGTVDIFPIWGIDGRLGPEIHWGEAVRRGKHWYVFPAGPFPVEDWVNNIGPLESFGASATSLDVMVGKQEGERVGVTKLVLVPDTDGVRAR